MTTHAFDEAGNRIGAVAQLLHAAALEVWARADRQAPDCPLHEFGMGVYLARTRAASMLPDDYENHAPDVAPEVENSEQQSTLSLLARAEELAQPLTMREPELAGLAGLLADLRALVHEVRSLDE